jgi:asparagine synthase (glutamine-hydrolysing)
MAAQISGRTKVVLQGDGGDELFGGYRRYATIQYYRLLHPVARVLQYVPLLMPKTPFGYRVQRYLHAYAAEDLATTIALLLTSEDRRWDPLRVFSTAFRQRVGQLDPLSRIRELFPAFAGHDIGNRMSFIDMSVILPDTYLEKVDRSTMAASLEVRVPFLDNDLVDYVLRLPGSAKMPFGRKKWLLKLALRGIVPDEVLYGPKTGFNVPFGRWLQTSLKPLFFDHLNRFAGARPDILNIEHIKALFTRTATGQQDHSPILWRILNFLVWANGMNIEFTSQGIK